jgi:hypothetical protein
MDQEINLTVFFWPIEDLPQNGVDYMYNQLNCTYTICVLFIHVFHVSLVLMCT